MKQIIITSFAALALFAATATYAHGNHGRALGRHNWNPTVGAIYTMDNSPDGNNVWVFGRRADGSLTTPTQYATSGLGTGTGLESQGAVQLSRDGHWLFVCDAGSDEISVFLATRQGLYLTDKIPSEGHLPVSIALHDRLVYVLNAGGAIPGSADNIAGFFFEHGKLIHLPGATYGLSADDTAPAEISFTQDGANIIVTEKATGMIDTFQVGDHGSVTGMKSFASPVPTPFGFAAGNWNRIFVTEANGGAATPGGSSVSSYQVTDNGDLDIISSSVPTHQTAACWIVLSEGERFAYTANTPNDSISSFFVHRDGALQLLQSQAAMLPTGSGPADMSFSHDGRFLYSLNAGTGTVGVFQLNRGTGALDPMDEAGSMPTTVNGLAAW